MHQPNVATIYHKLQQHAIVELPVAHDVSTYNSADQWLITLTAPNIDPSQFLQVWQSVHEQPLTIHRLQRLSKPLESLHHSQGLVLYGLNQGAHIAHVRQTLKTLGQKLAIDINIQTQVDWQTPKRLAVFDMDSTLIQAEVIDELAKVAGVGHQVADITAAAMAGEVDFQHSFTQRMALLKGLDSHTLEGIGRELVLTGGGENLMQNLRQQGVKTAIVSGGFDYFARLIQDRLQMDYAFANHLEIIDGKLTGQVTGAIVDADRKVLLLKQLAQQHGLDSSQTLAVGDGANDIPMLQSAGLGVAFCAKPKVQACTHYSINTLGLDGILYLLRPSP